MYRAEANLGLTRFPDVLTDLDYLCCLRPDWTEVRETTAYSTVSAQKKHIFWHLWSLTDKHKTDSSKSLIWGPTTRRIVTRAKRRIDSELLNYNTIKEGISSKSVVYFHYSVKIVNCLSAWGQLISVHLQISLSSEEMKNTFTYLVFHAVTRNGR